MCMSKIKQKLVLHVVETDYYGKIVWKNNRAYRPLNLNYDSLLLSLGFDLGLNFP